MLNEFKMVKIMNEAMLRTLKDKHKNYEKNLRIKEYLKDEAFFFKINKLDSFKILYNVGIKKENIEATYKKLISSDTFYSLLNKGIINSNDENLVIKYKIYSSEVKLKRK